MVIVEFSDWITKKYLNWRGHRVGNSASVREFARLFGVSQQVMSGWMKPGGKIPTKKEFINALLAAYPDDPDIYMVLGLMQPGDELISLDQLDPETRAELEALGLPFASEEDFNRMITVLRKRGMKITRKR